MVYYLIFLILLMLFIFLSNIKIEAKIIKRGENDEIVLVVYFLFGLFKYIIKIPFADIIDQQGNIIKIIAKAKAEAKGDCSIAESKNKLLLNYEELTEIKRRAEYYYKKYIKTVKYIKKKIVIRKITWNTEIGTGDAAETALLSGLFWIFKSMFYSVLKNNFKDRLQTTYIDVVPFYTSAKFNSAFNCIITLKAGYIIIAGFKLLINRIRMVKKNERASN